MEINPLQHKAKPKVKISSFFNTLKSKTLLILIVLQTAAIALVVILGWYLWVATSLPYAVTFWLCIALLAIANAAIIYIVFNKLSDALKVLSQAVAHVSKDPVVTPPPDTNDPKYEASGLRDMVKTIYELAAHTEQKDSPKTQESPFFKKLLDDLPCGVIALDATNKIVYSNPIAPVSVNSEGQNVIKLIFPQGDSINTWLGNSRVSKVRDLHEWHRVNDGPTGAASTHIFDVTAYYEKGGGMADTIIVSFDKTAIYSVDQQELDFIALAAHELRAPITVIRGYIDIFKQEMIQEVANNPDLQILLDRLQVSANQLSGYINNVLNASLFEHNNLKLHLREDNILEILKPLAPELTLRAKTQKRKLVFNVQPNLPTVATDRSAIAEVITNLVDNAIKYSPVGGEIIVTTILKDNFVETTVQDVGIGIPESIVSNLFTKFYRSHRSKQTVSGTGLGLYICKAIVENNGGSIWVRSNEGKGSTFGFSIPTYSSVADKLAKGDNKDIARRSEGWIKNHAMYRG